MAADFEYEYEFWIDAYSPKTIPMKRLGEYMAQLGRMLGNEDNIHFRKLLGGSTKVQYAVRREAVAKVEDRLEQIKHAEAANDVMRARDDINEMLRSDGAVAEIRPLRQGKTFGVKLRFPGREIQKPPKVGLKAEMLRASAKDWLAPRKFPTPDTRNKHGRLGNMFHMRPWKSFLRMETYLSSSFTRPVSRSK